MGSLSDKLRVTVTDADGDSSTSGSISLGLSGARPSLPPTPIPPSTEGGIHPGTDGKDTLTGGAGNDLFVGGKGNDLMTGGAGTDIFVFRPGEGNDTISDFDRSEGDALVMIGGGNYGQITGSYIPQDIHVVTTMVQGHDIDLSNSVSSHLLLGAGTNGNGSSQLDNSLAGGKGNDVISGGEGDNYLRGNEGHDYIVGGSGKDIMSGGEGNDTIYGGGGDDFIMGDSGNDFINAGSGENTIYGGQGADTFAWNKDSLGGKDIIGDFIPADGDKLSFTNLLSQGESLDAFFAEHIKGVTFDGTNSLAFTITDDGLSRDVQIAFSPTDPQFAAVVDAYNAASSVAEETQVLTSFLLSITTH